jgi:hypothetical protein
MLFSCGITWRASIIVASFGRISCLETRPVSRGIFRKVVYNIGDGTYTDSVRITFCSIPALLYKLNWQCCFKFQHSVYAIFVLPVEEMYGNTCLLHFIIKLKKHTCFQFTHVSWRLTLGRYRLWLFMLLLEKLRAAQVVKKFNPSVCT